MGYGWHNQGMGGGWGALMVVGMFVFLALFVIAMVALTRHHEHGVGGPFAARTSDGPLNILKERLARGEITPEEYSSRLTLLTGKK